MIAFFLPYKFSITLDEWYSAGLYFVAVFATFPSDDVGGYSTLFLFPSPLDDKCSHLSEEHAKLLNFVVEYYGRKRSNIVCITCNNCTTNKSMTKLMNIDFVRCASHRYNLASRSITQVHERSSCDSGQL